MNRRRQKKEANQKKWQSFKEFTESWIDNYDNIPRAAPLEEQQTPQKTDEDTGKEAAESGSQVSQELSSSTSAPSIPTEKNASDLPAEESSPHTGKETESVSQCSQESTTSAVPNWLNGKEPRAAPLEEQQTPPKTDEYTGKEAAESGSHVSQELTSSTSAPSIPAEKKSSDLPAEESSPHTGKETESVSQCSQISPTSSVLDFPESRAPPERSIPPNINYNSGRGPQGLTSSSVPYKAVEIYTSGLPPEKNPPQPNVNKITVKETKSGSKCSQESTTSSVPQVPVKHSAAADILRDEEDTETMKSNTTQMERIELGSSHAQNPFKTIAAAAVLGMKAPAIIVSRAKVSEEPWTVTGWLPEMDNIHPSAEELEAGLPFERLYDIIRHHDGSPPPSPTAQRLPVFQEIYQNEEFQQVPNTNDDTGRETESSSNGSQDLTISSVVKRANEKEIYDRDFPPLPMKKDK